MMRALPVSDVTSMLTSVTEDYETFVETSGLAAQPTVDNNAFTQLESETTRSEEMTKRQRSYLMALGVVFCFVVAITFVAIFGLMQRGRQSWYLLLTYKHVLSVNTINKARRSGRNARIL